MSIKALKFSYLSGPLRRVPLTSAPPNFADISHHVLTCFPELASAPSWHLEYVDDEGDSCQLSSDAELADALVTAADEGRSSLKLTVVAAAAAPAATPAATPETGGFSFNFGAPSPGFGVPDWAISAVLSLFGDDEFAAAVREVQADPSASALACQLVARSASGEGLASLLPSALSDDKIRAVIDRVAASSDPLRALIDEAMTTSPGTPAPPKPQKPDAVHDRVMCDGCEVCPIVGPRFKSAVLPDFDLCAACEASGTHTPAAPFIKINYPSQAPAAILALLPEGQPWRRHHNWRRGGRCGCGGGGGGRGRCGCGGGSHFGGGGSHFGGGGSHCGGRGGRGRRHHPLSGAHHPAHRHRRGPYDSGGPDEPTSDDCNKGFGRKVLDETKRAFADPWSFFGNGNSRPAGGPFSDPSESEPTDLEKAIAASLEESSEASQTAAAAAAKAVECAKSVQNSAEKAAAKAKTLVDANSRDGAGEGAGDSTEDADLKKAIAASLAEGANAAAQAAAAAAKAAKAAQTSKVIAGGGARRPRHRPVARYVKDVTISDGTVLPPGTPFTKIWRLRNEGGSPWPENCRFQHVGGDRLHALDGGVPLPPTPPSSGAVDDESSDSAENPSGGGEVDVAVELRTPRSPGRYVGYWRCCDANGQRFGHRVWIDIVVSESDSTVQAAAMAMSPEGASAELQRMGESSKDSLGQSDDFVTVEAPDAGTDADISAAADAELLLGGDVANSEASLPASLNSNEQQEEEQQQQHAAPEMQQLLAMGFTNQEENQRVLDANGNDITLSVSQIVRERTRAGDFIE